MDSSPDNDGTDQYRQMVRVRLARQKGVREDASDRTLLKIVQRLDAGGSGPRSDAHPHSNGMWVTPWPVDVAGREATVKVCGAGCGDVGGA